MKNILYLIMFFLVSTAVADAQMPEMAPPSGPNDPIPPIGMNAPTVNPVERISPGVYRIGKVTVNKNDRSITFPAKINMTAGLLEYVLVRRGGKTHESLLNTEAEPYDIQLACLLLDLVGTDHPLAFQGAPEIPKGDKVDVSLAIDVRGKPQVIRPERWIVRKSEQNSRDVDNLTMVFTGSVIDQGRFMAQIDGSIIALYHDPVALIDNASPGGESDKIWFVKEDSAPPVGTPVTVTIKPAR